MNFWENNIHVQRSTKCRNKRNAEVVERAFRTQIARNEFGIDAKKPVPTYNAAMKEFLLWCQTEHAARPATTRRYATSSKALIEYFGDKSLDQITPDDVQKFKQWRSKQKKQAPNTKLRKSKKAASNAVIKPATVNRELACLKIVFNHFIKQDVIAKNPVSRVKFLQENNENFVVLSPSDEKVYLLACSQPLQDVAGLMLDCGCRPDEIYRLRKSDVNLDGGFLLIPDGKTQAARRRIPLTARAVTILESRINNSNGDYLFAGGRNGDDVKNPIVKLNNAHSGALKWSDLKKFRIYDLRHTFASRMAMAGVDLVTLAALLGHSRVQMVMRYAHPVEAHKIDAVAKLESYNAAKQKSG
jgi:integrase